MIAWDNVAYNIRKQDLAQELSRLLHPDNGGGSRMFGIWQSTSGLKNKNTLFTLIMRRVQILLLMRICGINASIIHLT